MESPSPSDGAHSNLSKEQLIEYVKKQKMKIKMLESQLASQTLPLVETSASEGGVSSGAFMQSQLEEQHRGFEEARESDGNTIELLREQIAILQTQLTSKEDANVEGSALDGLSEEKLKKGLTVAKSIIGKNKETIADLEAQAEALRAELLATTSALSEAQESALSAGSSSAHAEELLALREQVERLSLAHADSAQPEGSVEEALALRESVIGLQEENARLADSLRLAREEASSERAVLLSAQLDAALLQLSNATGESGSGRLADELAAELQGKTSELDALLEQYGEARAANEALRRDQEELTGLRALAETLKLDNAQLRLECSSAEELGQRAVSLARDLAERDALLEELAGKLGELQTSVRDSSDGRLLEALQRAEDLEAELASARTAAADAAACLDEARAQESSAHELLASLAAATSQVETLQAEAVVRDEAQQRSEESMAALEERVSLLSEELAAKAQALEALAGSAATSDAALKSGEEAIAAEQAKSKKAMAKLKQTTKQLADKTAEADRLAEALRVSGVDLEESRAKLVEMGAVSARLSEVSGSLAAAEAELVELRDKDKASTKSIKSLTEQCSSLMERNESYERTVEELTSSVSELQSKEKSLAKKNAALDRTVADLNEKLKAAGESHGELEVREKQLSTLAKKLKAEKTRLTERLKEVEEAGAALEQKSAVVADDLAKTLTRLAEESAARERLETSVAKMKPMEARLAELVAANSDLQKKVTDAQTDIEWALKDAEVAREEGASLRADRAQAESEEIAGLRKRVEDLSRMLRDKKKELSAARQENAALVASIEEERSSAEAAIEQTRASAVMESSSLAKDKDKELRARDKEIRKLQSSLSALESSKEELVQQMEQVNSDMAARDRAVENLRASNGALKGDLEKLRAQADEDRRDFDSKLEAVNDKNRKMKALLGKTRTVLQEKEKKEQEIASVAPPENRMLRFAVSSVLSLPDRDGVARSWCLVRDEGARAEGAPVVYSAASNGYLWVPLDTANSWEALGSSVVGKKPAPLDVVWSERKAESDAKVRALEAEKKSLLAQLDESAQTFNTYKTRAQAALKKVSGDDKSERKRIATVEETELEKATEQLAQLQEEHGALRRELQSVELSKSIADSSLRDLSSKLAETTAVVDALRRGVEVAQGDARLAVVARETETIKRLEAECLVSSLQTQLERANAASSAVLTVDDARPSQALSEGSGEPEAPKSSARLPTPDKGESKGKSAILSSENTDSLDSENTELRHMIALSNEQVHVLKEDIRDLELKLVREIEFNSSSHRVNAEYLMNVLKKFLMSEVPSERSKLAVVLCSILHVRPDESKVIEEKWMEKRPAGLAGWFSRTKPARVAEHEESDHEHRGEELLSEAADETDT